MTRRWRGPLLLFLLVALVAGAVAGSGAAVWEEKLSVKIHLTSKQPPPPSAGGGNR